MRKRGFTLVELMGVLIIIGMLMLILIPVISNVIKEQKNNQYIQQTNTIKLAAKNFGSDNLVVLPTKDDEYIYITLGQLKGMGYMDQSIINPKTNEEFSDCIKIKITKKGSNFDYEYVQESENVESCSTGSGVVAIGEPNHKYINNQNETMVLITIKDSINENMFMSYTIQKDKIKLITSTGSNTDATFNIRESNGSFSVIVKGGNDEGELILKLEKGAILKNGSEDLIPNNGLESEYKIIVDNTAPTIVFGTNGNNNWSREVSSKITVTDSSSGGDETSYKHIYTKASETPNKEFVNENTYTLNGVTGEYRLVAYACDNAGNCKTEKSNIFKLDNTEPTKPTVVLVNGSWEVRQNNTWYNHDIYIPGSSNSESPFPSSSDEGSGVEKYQISIDNKTWYDWNYSSQNSLYSLTTDGTITRYIRAVDNVGLSSPAATVTVKVDKSNPTIVSASTNSCESNMRTITVKASDNLSGISGYVITKSKTIPAISSFNSITNSSWTTAGYSSGTYYAWVKDKTNNISSYKEVSVASCPPTIVCNTNGAYTYHWPDGTNQTTDLITTKEGECSVSAVLPFVEGEVYTSSYNIFNISNYDSYSVKRKVCNDAGICITCDEENDLVSNCKGTQPSFRKTKGYCVDDYCTVEYILTAINSSGSTTKTFTYYFKY